MFKNNSGATYFGTTNDTTRHVANCGICCAKRCGTRLTQCSNMKNQNENTRNINGQKYNLV